MKKARESFKTLLLAVAGIGLLFPGSAVVWGWDWYQKRYSICYEKVRLLVRRVITIHQKRCYYENYETTWNIVA